MTQTLQKKVSKFTKSESLFEPHLKAISSYTHYLCIFLCYTWGFVFVQFNYWQFDPIYFLIHWLILAYRHFRQQVPSLNCVQLLPSFEVHNLLGKMWNTFYIQLFAYILYVFCIQIIYIVLMMYTFCRSELMYTKCIQDVYKIYPTFQQTFVYILYTNFNCQHSSFNFAYKMYTNVWWNVGYIL